MDLKEGTYSQNDDDLNLALALSLCTENDFKKNKNEFTNTYFKKENGTIEKDEDINLALLLSMNADSDFDENEEINNNKDNLTKKNENLDNAQNLFSDSELDFEDENFFNQIDEDLDYALALSLQSDWIYEDPNKNNQNSTNECRSIIDKKWELIDPTPDIHALFIEFNVTYFWNALTTVEVRWSHRMTLCAGVCCYEGRNGLCSIRLSLPLLKLRPRKDLVETLLHEMIHAYLFVTHNNRDRTGHGPEFLKHMHRINKESGAHITVYHSFHDEVNAYRKHWWQCNGPCQKQAPFFGLVKRATNRAPSNLDFWWADHLKKCGGSFNKIKEPENYKGKGTKRKLDLSGTTKIDTYFSKNGQISGAEKFKGNNTSFNNEREPTHSNIHTLTSFKENKTPLSIFHNKRNTMPYNILKTSNAKETTKIPFKGKSFVLGSDKSTCDDKRNDNSFQVKQKANKNVALISSNKPTTFSRFKTKDSKTSNISSHKMMTGTCTASASKTVVITKKAKEKTANVSSNIQQMHSFPGTGHVLGTTASTSKEQISETLSPKNDSKMPKQSPINNYFKTNEKKDIPSCYSSSSNNQNLQASTIKNKVKCQSPIQSPIKKYFRTNEKLDVLALGKNVKEEYNFEDNSVVHNNQLDFIAAVPPKDVKVKCPICNVSVISEKINSHLDDYCLR